GNGQDEAGENPLPIDMDCAGPALSVVAALLRAHKVHMLAQRVEKRRPHIKRDAVVATIHIQDQLGKACVAFDRWCRQGPRTRCDWNRGKTGCRAKQSSAARATVVLTQGHVWLLVAPVSETLCQLPPARLCPYFDDRRSSWLSTPDCSAASACWPRSWRPAISSGPPRCCGSRHPASAVQWRGSKLGLGCGCWIERHVRYRLHTKVAASTLRWRPCSQGWRKRLPRPLTPPTRSEAGSGSTLIRGLPDWCLLHGSLHS